MDDHFFGENEMSYVLKLENIERVLKFELSFQTFKTNNSLDTE